MRSFNQIDRMMQSVVKFCAYAIQFTEKNRYFQNWNKAKFKHPPRNIRGFITGSLYYSIKVDQFGTEGNFNTATITSRGVSDKGFAYGRVHEYGGTRYNFSPVKFTRNIIVEAKRKAINIVKGEIRRWLR